MIPVPLSTSIDASPKKLLLGLYRQFESKINKGIAPWEVEQVANVKDISEQEKYRNATHQCRFALWTDPRGYSELWFPFDRRTFLTFFRGKLHSDPRGVEHRQPFPPAWCDDDSNIEACYEGGLLTDPSHNSNPALKAVITKRYSRDAEHYFGVDQFEIGFSEYWLDGTYQHTTITTLRMETNPEFNDDNLNAFQLLNWISSNTGGRFSPLSDTPFERSEDRLAFLVKFS